VHLSLLGNGGTRALQQFDVRFVDGDGSILLQKLNHDGQPALTLDLGDGARQFQFLEGAADNSGTLTDNRTHFCLKVVAVLTQQAGIAQICFQLVRIVNGDALRNAAGGHRTAIRELSGLRCSHCSAL